MSLAELSERYGRHVPLAIESALDHLEKIGLNTEGLFRLSGHQGEMDRLQASLDRYGAKRHSRSVTVSDVPVFLCLCVCLLSSLSSVSLSVSEEELILCLCVSSSGDSIDWTAVHDVHSISGLIKLFLRALPDPLLTYAFYDAFIVREGFR